MLRLFKKLKVPTGDTKEITELESYTVTWEVFQGWSGVYSKYSKVIINQDDALEFKRQLEASAKFIKAPIQTQIIKN
jgi:hypothetical protein